MSSEQVDAQLDQTTQLDAPAVENCDVVEAVQSVDVINYDNELEVEETAPAKKSRFSFGKTKKSKAEKGLSSDFVIILSVYSSICGIMTVYSAVLPMAQAGPMTAFWDVIFVGCLFTYSICLIVIGLRPNDATMLDTIFGESVPKAKLWLQIIGQFTSGWMMVLFQWVGFLTNCEIMQMAFTGKQQPSPAESMKIYHNCCIIFIFIMLSFVFITNTAIFVPLASLPTLATVLGFITTIWWVSKVTTKDNLKGWVRGWTHTSGNWAVSKGDGISSLFGLIGVLAADFYLHSMIQQLLVNAKFPEHNVRNTILAFVLAMITILFTNFVATLPFGNYMGVSCENVAYYAARNEICPASLLVSNMGSYPLVRANNVILFLFSLPVIPFQWAVLRQCTINLLPWQRPSWKKWYWPTLIVYQTAIVLIGFGIAWKQPNIQILMQVGSFPSSVWWCCTFPFIYHIWSMTNNPAQRSKAYYWPWVCTDVAIGCLLFFCEIVQFIPKW